MAPIDDLANEPGVAVGHPPEHEERAFDLTLVEQVQQPLRVRLNPARVTLPVSPIDDVGEGFDMEVVLDVHRKDISVSHGASRGG